DAGSRVDHVDDRPTGLYCFMNPNLSARLRGLDSIQYHIEDHLLHLFRIECKRRQKDRAFDEECDLLLVRLRPDKRSNAVDEIVNVRLVQCGSVRPGIGQDLADESLQSRQLLPTDLGKLRFRSTRGHPRRNDFQSAFDTCQRIMNLMSEACGDLTKGRQS